MTTIRAAIVDDHPLFREGLLHAFSREADIEVVEVGQSAEDAVSIASALKPDIILMDMSMPGGGVTAIERISAICPTVKVLVLSAIADQTQVCAAMRKGARGYVLKGIGITDLMQTVRLIVVGGTYVEPSLAAHLLAHFGEKEGRLSGLAPREEQVLQLITLGFSNKEVARALLLTEKTVKHYVTSVLRKLNVRNRVEAAMLGRGM